MRKTAIFFFALWLVTAYGLVFSMSDSRNKSATILSQQARIAGAEEIAAQVLEIYNRRGPGPGPR